MSSNLSNTPLNRIPEDPTLRDLLDQVKKEVFLSLNCHAIATVQSVSYTDQTLTATIDYSQTFYKRPGNTGPYVPTLVPYPVLLDCPFISLGGGNGALTFPIKEGDQCLILFNDRDLDNWFSGATSGPVATPRLHSLSDGIALVGLNDLTDYDGTRVVLKNGDTMIGLGDSLIKIENATQNLNSLLQSLISTISGLTTIPAAIGTPLTLNPSVITQLTNIATELGELLE